MILSQTAEYALRTMATISVSQGARPMCAAEISKNIDCPKHYLSKVLRKLVNAGLLRAEKGHGGGFILAKKSELIFFCHIMEAVETKTKRKHCIFGWRQCNSKKPCVLHHRWNKVNNAFVEWSKNTSLKDIQIDAKSSTWLFSSGKPKL